MTWHLTFTPEDDADLLHRRGTLRQKWHDIAFIMGRSKSACHRRYGELVPTPAPSIVPEQGPKRKPLHVRLGIATHVHRQALLADSRVGLWDEQEHVWSHDHRYREAISLAGA